MRTTETKYWRLVRLDDDQYAIVHPGHEEPWGCDHISSHDTKEQAEAAGLDRIESDELMDTLP